MLTEVCTCLVIFAYLNGSTRVKLMLVCVFAVCHVMEDVMCVDEETVQRLTDGFMSHYLPELNASKQTLQELTYE